MTGFADVFKEDLIDRPKGPPRHNVKHHILTEGPPTHSRFRRLPPDKLKVAKREFKHLERAGICQKASTPWASPLHMVPKKDGSWRPCGDYRLLNTKTVPDHYPLPNMTDITNGLAGSKYFSRLDLLKGYYQVPVAEDDVEKTAVITPFGTYTFNFTCFGLRNAGATFQRLMDSILGDLPFVVVYVDDILIFSPSFKQHLSDIQQVLEKLRENGLIVKPSKCEWAKKRIEFLGHIIDGEGVAPLPQKVAAVQNFPTPSTIKNLQEFAGMVNYYHRFLPHIAAVMGPLYQALKGKPKKLAWTPLLQKAFENTKSALAAAAKLSYPSSKDDLILTTDASSTAIGGVLEQDTPNGRRPISFFSRKLSHTETRYSTFDRELLAVHKGVRQFRHLLEGRPFKILTDHLPLVHAFTKTADAWSPRQQRQLSAIAEYPCSISYLRGSSNQVADALSRNAHSLNAVQIGLNYSDIARAQQGDKELQRLRQNQTKLTWVECDVEGLPLVCETSTGRSRPYLPPSVRKQAFNQAHNLSHPSGRSMVKILTERFLWEGMRKDIRQWAQECLSCQKAKVGRHTETGIGDFNTSPRRLAHLHVDVVGPLPPSEGFRYLFTIIDRNTRWPEAIPLRQQTAETCGKALIEWVARHGVPETIVSDRGTTFTSKLWSALADSLGTAIHHTTSYNPEANGLVERFHRTLKAALMARCNAPNWRRNLPWVLLGIRTTPHAALNYSPAEALYGQALRIPADMLPGSGEPQTLADIRKAVADIIPTKTYAGNRQTYVPTAIQTAQYVFVRVDHHRPPLSPPYAGPFPVLERQQKSYKVQFDGKAVWVSVDRLKPAHSPPDYQSSAQMGGE